MKIVNQQRPDINHTAKKPPAYCSCDHSFVAIITGGTLYITMRWADFTVKEYDIFAMLSISNAEYYPLSLEERYEFTYNVTGYEKEVMMMTAFDFQ